MEQAYSKIAAGLMDAIARAPIDQRVTMPNSQTDRERVARALFLTEKFGQFFNDDTYGQVLARIEAWDVLHDEDFDVNEDDIVNPFLTVTFQCEDGSYASYGKDHFRILADAAIAAMTDWQDISTAPFGQEVEIRAGMMQFRAKLMPDVSMNSEGQPCDQWQATREGEHPPCWSDGACWESNADESPSLQPTHWRPLPAPPTHHTEP